jgi:hypothetical protein
MNELQTTSTASMLFEGNKIDKMMMLADVMAQGTVTVPAHLRGKPSDCLAIIMQAAQWGINPFAAAQKTHLVNGILGYEAQLVNAVIQSSNAIRGSFHYEHKGEGQTVSCRVGAVLNGQSEITWGEWLHAASITTKNSPLWKTAPAQQLSYLAVKYWARLYAPGAILGVYSVDELQDTPLEKTVCQIHEDSQSIDDVLDAIEAIDSKEAQNNCKALITELTLESDRKIAITAYKRKIDTLKASAQAKVVPEVDQTTGEITQTEE